mmetsp:Transcript_14624/g.37276  ORF Transcript_14624/g.37276 Transcript_14624/m.37276 type:complete len:242 (-) Transcript_14624:25-750(-)
MANRRIPALISLALAATALFALLTPSRAAGQDPETCTKDCNVVLTYFDGKGRAEAIRIALFAAGVPFEDKRVDYSVWSASNMKAETPGQALPVLSVDGQVYTQSIAIARWAGKKSSLYPSDDRLAMRCDEIMDVFQEVLTKTPQDPDAGKKAALRKAYSEGPMRVKMELVNSYAEAAGEGFSCGDGVTVADLSIMGFVDMIRAGDFDHVPPSYIDQFPALVALASRTAESKVVKGYYASKA